MNLAQKKARLSTVTAECKTLMATIGDREPTASEKANVDRLMNEARALREQIDDVELNAMAQQLAGEVPGTTARVGDGSTRRFGGSDVIHSFGLGGESLGAAFVNSDTYRWLQHTRDNRGRVWHSPTSELSAALLQETPTSPPSGGSLVIPQYLPGIFPTPTRPLAVSELIAPGTATSNAIVYMVETLFDNAADTVEEGAEKPESTLQFDDRTDPVKKIAHWIPVTDEMLDDVPALRSYIDTRLRLGVQLTEDDQLLNGDGENVNADLVGILNRSGLTAALPRGSDTNEDAILKQIAAIFLATGTMPDGVVMNPNNWLPIQLRKTTTGEYIGGGPFQVPLRPRLWGLPVALTTGIAEGTSLVGAFATAAQVFRKGGIRVDVSNSHADFFIKNKTAIRAELREALAVYRPAAFGTVTGLTT